MSRHVLFLEAGEDTRKNKEDPGGTTAGAALNRTEREWRIGHHFRIIYSMCEGYIVNRVAWCVFASAVCVEELSALARHAVGARSRGFMRCFWNFRKS